MVVGFKTSPDDSPWSEWGMLPRVSFAVGSEGRRVQAVVEPQEWSNEMAHSVVASRLQLPLRPAWAMSVHKSQGMTISCLEVSLAGAFEYGQAYVALSRATSLDGLKLIDFRPNAVRTHKRVKDWYSALISGSLEFQGSSNESRQQPGQASSSSAGATTAAAGGWMDRKRPRTDWLDCDPGVDDWLTGPNSSMALARPSNSHHGSTSYVQRPAHSGGGGPSPMRPGSTRPSAPIAPMAETAVQREQRERREKNKLMAEQRHHAKYGTKPPY